VSRQLPLALDAVSTSFADDDFLVAPSNREARAWIERWPEWPGAVLLLVGPGGSGKTHLASIWRRKSAAQSVALADLNDERAGELVSEGGAVLCEDADRGGVSETALLHLYNLTIERRAHLLLTARRAPSRWPLALADLRSRLNATPRVEIGAPEDELLGAVLVKLFDDHQLRVSSEAVAYLLPRIERSLAAAWRIVHAIDKAALAEKRSVTVPLVRRVLEEGVRTGTI
jgi:chromosomal replication initiation ATPase DnaA